ncbi:MAG: putative Ig domain-containing protein, partial [Terracidiphilus sp.]
GQTLSYAASVTNDSNAAGVTWSMSGTTCTGAACGTFTSGTTSAAIYKAPATVSAKMTVTIVATSVTDTTKAMSSTVVVSPAPSITTTSLAGGAVGIAYSATLQATGGVGTLTWSLASGSSPPAGLTLSNAGAISGTPTAASTTAFTVKVTDQSTAHEGPVSVTQQLSLTIAPPPISVSLNPSAQTGIDQGQTLNFTATVANDSGNKGVTWVASGTTCSGNACGTFTNATTSAATYNAPASVSSNTTVAVQAFSVADSTKSAATALVISPSPVITTTSLAGGAVGTAYSTTLQATGGTGALSWGLASGSSLPAGLSLNAAGGISGTPTAAGSPSFTVKVTDASQGQQGPVSATQQLSLTIAPAALTIITTSLPNAVVGGAYNVALVASGGTPPYTWTVASGSTLPSWLSITGSGTSWQITGTPTAAETDRFSLKLTDSGTPTPQSKNQSYNLNVTTASAACPTGNESAMKGQFAFSLTGYTPDGFLGAIGSFTADGSGNITAGYVDANGAQIGGNGVGVQAGNVTAAGSSYTMGADNRGCATIVTSFYTFTTRFAIPPSTSGNAEGTIQEFEPSPAYFAGSGQLFQQKISSSVPQGVWVYAQKGVFDGVRVSVAGTKTISSGGQITAGEYDSNFEGTVHNYSGITGTYGTPDPVTGRYTLTTTLSGISLNRAAYEVSPTQEIEITTSGASTTIEVGYEQLQSGALTLSGNLASFGSGAGPSGMVAQFSTMSVSGSNYTAKLYENDGGTWVTPTPTSLTCSYTIDANGRVTTIGTNCGSSYSINTWSLPVYYLTGPNTGFVLGTDKRAVLGQLVPQSATTITAGNYYFGTMDPMISSIGSGSWDTVTGVATISAGDTITGTEDSSPEGSNEAVNQSLTVNSDGTFSSSTDPGVITGLVISSSELIQMNDPTNLWPTILVYKKVPVN